MCCGEIFMTDPSDKSGQMDPTPGYCVSQNGDVTLRFSCLWVSYLWWTWSCMSFIYIVMFIYLLYIVHACCIFYMGCDCPPHVFIRSKHFWMPKIGHLEAINSAAPWKFHPLCLWTIPFWIVKAYEISIKSPFKSLHMDFHLKSLLNEHESI